MGETVGETVGETIRGTPAQIIEQMQSNPGITSEELSKVLGLSIRGIEYHLKKLREANIIERIGSTKKGYWKVNT